MAQKSQTVEKEPHKKRQPRARVLGEAQRAGQQSPMAQLVDAPVRALSAGSGQEQAARLGDGRFQSAQRRALAAQVGSVEGNLRLQRTIASLRASGKGPSAALGHKQVTDRQAIQRADDEGIYEQPSMTYYQDSAQDLNVGKTKTGWGTVWWPATDDSDFEAIGYYTAGPKMTNGVGNLISDVSLYDFRDQKLGNKYYYPKAKVQLKWEQRKPEGRLKIGRPALEYKPAGGGGLRVVVQYFYGGYKTTPLGKAGYHNLLFTYTYSSNTSRTSSSGAELGGEYSGVSAKISASTSTTVTDAAISWKREIAFHSIGA